MGLFCDSSSAHGHFFEYVNLLLLLKKIPNNRTNTMETNKIKIFINTVFWGFALWLFGYVLGFIFFAFVPKDLIGWYILPFGVITALWVLFKKIKREKFKCYIGLGFIWTILAVVLDYVFLVKLLKAINYYKFDVYIYYILTFLLPIVVGWYKLNRVKSTK
jgi:hypothetical protein